MSDQFVTEFTGNSGVASNAGASEPIQLIQAFGSIQARIRGAFIDIYKGEGDSSDSSFNSLLMLNVPD